MDVSLHGPKRRVTNILEKEDVCDGPFQPKIMCAPPTTSNKLI